MSRAGGEEPPREREGGRERGREGGREGEREREREREATACNSLFK
jgi:hypothetical protein